MRGFRQTIELFKDQVAIDPSVKEAPSAIHEAGGHFTVQLSVNTGTATVELYGRLTSNAPWALFKTVVVDTAGFLMPFFGIPNVAHRVAAVTGGAVASGWVFADV